MAIIKTILKKGGGSCKWCAQGQCWSHGQVAKGKGKGGGGVICNTCGKPGHKSPDCFQGAKGKGKAALLSSLGGGFGGGVVCHNCGKPGHKSPDCFQGAKGGFGGGGFGGAGIVCHNCGKPGHKSPDCFQGAKGGFGGGGFGGAGIVCHNCGKPGHKSPDCFQGAKGKGGGGFGGGVVCHNCGQPGHKSPDCYQGAKGGFGGGKGKGKGLRGFPAEKKVWIGGLPTHDDPKGSKDRNKELLEHMKQAGNCKWCEIGKSGSGGAAYATAEDAATAIATLNGTAFGGSVLAVDVWTKKEKE